MLTFMPQIHKLGTMVFSLQILVIIIQFSQSDRMWNLRYLTNIVIKENSQIKNISKFRKKLCKLDWNTTLISDSALLDFSYFFSMITDLFNSSFPVKKI